MKKLFLICVASVCICGSSWAWPAILFNPTNGLIIAPTNLQANSLSLNCGKVISSLLITNYDFYAPLVIYGNNQFFGNTNYPEAQSPSMAMIPLLWYDNDSYLHSTNALGNPSRLAKFELDFASSTTPTNFPGSYVNAIVQFVYNLATGYTYARVFQDLFVDGNARVTGSLTANGGIIVSNGLVVSPASQPRSYLGSAYSAYFPYRGAAYNNHVFDTNYPDAGFIFDTHQGNGGGNAYIQCYFKAVSDTNFGGNSPYFIVLDYDPTGVAPNRIRLSQKVEILADVNLNGQSATNGNFVGTFADSSGTLPASNTILTSGTIITNSINSVSGVITNNGLVWFAVKTNGVPSLTAPNGSFCTTTNGAFFVRTNGVWLQK